MENSVFGRVGIAVGGIVLVLMAGSAQAVTPVTITTATYTQNFNGLRATAGTAGLDTVPAGWLATETGSAADGQLIAGTGASAGGDGGIYSFGQTNSTDRALGTLRSLTVLPTIYASFRNGNATAITSLAIAYTGEMWRRGLDIDNLNFAYSIEGGAYVDFDDLDFPATPGIGSGPLNGNTNNVLLSANLTGLALLPGQTITFRWLNDDYSSFGVVTNDALAIDDFSLSPTVAAVPEPASWAMMVGGFGLMGGVLRRRPNPAANLA